MDKNLYQCRGCGVTMRSKPRPGSRQFQDGATDNPGGAMVSSMILDGLQARSLGTTEVDNARTADPENWSGWRVDKDSPNHNFTTVWFSEREQRFLASDTVHVRQKDGLDLVIKVTINDYPEKEPATPRSTLESWFKRVEGLTPMERKIYFCYLTGGHSWELKERADG